MTDDRKSFWPEVWLLAGVLLVMILLVFLGGCESRRVEYGYYMIDGCRIIYADGGSYGITLPDPVDGEPLHIPPGSVAAWGDPVPIEVEEVS